MTQFANYYAALIAAWNTNGLPMGAQGTAMNTADTTANRLAAVNSWTVAGTALSMVVPTYKIYNAIVPAEFQALTTAMQQYVRDVLALGAVDVSNGTNARAVLLQAFAAGSATRTALIALAASYDAPRVPWWQANGMLWAPTIYDLIAAALIANPTGWTFTARNKRRDPNNKNIVVDIAYAQVDGSGNPTGATSADNGFGFIATSDNDVSVQALKRIVNVFLPGDAALAALTAN